MRVVALFIFAFTCQAWAHMPSGYDLRAIHFVSMADGLHAYYRLTFPLVVASGMGSTRPDGFFDAPPFTLLRIESAHAFYYPDVERIRRTPTELAQLIAKGHRLEIRGQAMQPEVQSVRVYPKGYVPPFNTLDQVRRATEPGEVYPANAPQVDAAFALVDVHIVYPGITDEFRLSSTLSNQIIGQPEVQNLIVDHRADGDVIYRNSGLMIEPMLINPSGWSAIRSFILLGAQHVLSGMDHLLLIMCLTLGAACIASMAWRITGFTLGHTVSLFLGFWGYVPTDKWFVPAVETAIALSILIAGVSLLFDQVKHRMLMLLIIIVGFVHGLGFSFTLSQMLDVHGPRIWTSLAAFNIGVELAQILFAAVVTMGLYAGLRLWPDRKSIVFRIVALACVAVSVYWGVDRIRPLFA